MIGQNYAFNRTVQDAINQAIAEAIGSTASTLTALQTKQLIYQIDVLNKMFVNAAHTRHSSGGWSWMEKVPPYNFQTQNHTGLSAAIAAGAITLTLTDSSHFPSSGQLWIMTSKNAVNFFTYTGNNTSTGVLTGVSGINIAHTAGETVEMTYALPSDYAKTKHLLIDAQEYLYDQMVRLPYGGTFDFMGSSIVLPQNIGSHDCTLLYEKAPTQLNTSTTSTDNSGVDVVRALDIPDDFFPWMIEMLKSYIFRTRRMNDKADDCVAKAMGPLYLRDGSTGGMLSEYLNYDASYTTANLIQPPW